MEVLALLVGSQVAARLAAMGIEEKKKQFVGMAVWLFAALIVFAQPANAAWRGEFPRIADLDRLYVGDAVEVTCFDDEAHPDYQMQAWPPGWLRWEAQVLSEDSPGVYTLGAFPDLMAGKTSFEQFWATLGDDLLLSTELPYVELKDFMQDWPNIPPEDAGHITMTYANGLWSFNSKTMIRRFGICGASCTFDTITGDEMDMTWSPVADRFEGIATVTGKPGCCLQRSWQPYYCEVGQVRCQDYCAYLAEYDGRWEEQINMWRVAIENWGFTPTQVEQFFQWQLAALEVHTTTNACPGAGDEGVTPRLIGAQCEILQELIEFNRISPSRLAVLVPQYQRLECPCKEDANANGLPDYFDYAIPSLECPDVAMVTETLAHEEFMIPVPEPGQTLLLGVGISALIGLRRWKLSR